MSPRHRPASILLALCAAAFLSTAAAVAQPFGAWLVSSSSASTKYVEVPSSADLNPLTAITIEAWVSNTAISASDCRSIVGKDWHTSYWLGVCGNTFRTYLFGTPSNHDGGIVPNGQWTHVAVTYDGTSRRHYINGELISTFAETGSLPASSAALRIASDVSWQFSPGGAINEVRLWSVARTTDQIRAAINTPITAAQPGLVAVWSDGLHDALGAHTGTNVGGVGFLTFPVTLNCTPSPTSLCLSGRFAVSVQWRDFSGVTGVGTVVPGASADSGLFWFFAPAAWEVLAKTVNGCSLNNRWWAFGAATTNVFYRLEFTDVRAGAAKIYFNYPGVASPAVTDAAAFGTCP